MEVDSLKFDNSCLEIYGKKIALAEKFIKSTIELNAAIDAEEDTQIAEQLEVRQQLIQEINSVTERLIQFISDSNNKEIMDLQKKYEKIMKEVYMLEQENMKKIRKLQNNIEDSMKHINQGRNAIVNGYFKQQAQVYGYYIDQKIGK